MYSEGTLTPTNQLTNRILTVFVNGLEPRIRPIAFLILFVCVCARCKLLFTCIAA